MHLPEPFVKSIRSLLAQEADACLSAIAAPPVATSIRLNPYKVPDMFPGAGLVPWHPRGRSLTERPSFIGDPLFHAGAYYVQESSSMFVGHVLHTLKKNLSNSIRVLDLCAAPGGKSTVMLDELTDNDLLVSNEIIKTRVHVLEENLVKWGRSNVMITNNDPARIGTLSDFFDVMLIDAPCSGEGMFRKDKEAVNEWSEQHVALCAQRQQRILADALHALKPGGYLIYSTCTFNKEENEANVKRLITDYGYQPVSIPVDESWGIRVVNEYEGTPMFAYRFYPHQVSGEGFFLACLKKPGELSASELKTRSPRPDKLSAKELEIVKPWIDNIEIFEFFKNELDVYAIHKSLVPDLFFLRSKLTTRLSGLKAGEIFKGKLVPDHQLALSVHKNKSIPSIGVERLQALTFLKKETFHVDPMPQDIYLITYKDQGLGWVKVMPNRINNYLPVSWRILKDLGDLH